MIGFGRESRHILESRGLRASAAFVREPILGKQAKGRCDLRDCDPLGLDPTMPSLW